MNEIKKLIEIESLLENIMKSEHDGGILRIKILLFCSIYENLSVSMIIDKLGIKKTNFALMTSSLEKEGCIIIKKSNLDKRCRLIELTEKGRKELNAYVKKVEEKLSLMTFEVEKAIETVNAYLNKNI